MDQSDFDTLLENLCAATGTLAVAELDLTGAEKAAVGLAQRLISLVIEVIDPAINPKSLEPPQ